VAQLFSEWAERDPTFFQPYLNDVVGAMLTVAKNTGFPDGSFSCFCFGLVFAPVLCLVIGGSVLVRPTLFKRSLWNKDRHSLPKVFPDCRSLELKFILRGAHRWTE
jgi:hypothetical protein